jgi:tetratricopeptide (TPR) repeat protein
MEQNHEVAAKAELERLVIRYPKDASIRLELAKSLADDKKYSEAIDQAKAVIDVNANAYPDGPLALQNMRQWAIDGSLDEKIVTVLRDLADKNPANTSILFQLSAATDTLMQKRKTPVNANDPGWVNFQRLKKSHPDSQALLWAMNDYAKRRGLVSERIALMEQEGKSDPKSPSAFAVLGAIYDDQKDWTKAEAAYREAARRAPSEAAYKIALAKTLESAGKPKEALDAYEDAKKNDPTNKTITDAITRLSAAPSGQ